MNTNFDGGRGMYGSVLLGALAELGSVLSKPEQDRRTAGRSWKSTLLVLAVIATPVVMLLAGGQGF
jgi:hypothetical protein